MQNNGGRLVRAEATDIVKLSVRYIENRCKAGLTVQIDIGHGRRLERSKNPKSWRLRPSPEIPESIIFLNVKNDQVPGFRRTAFLN